MAARKRRIRSRHAVGASLDPRDMAQYIQQFYGEQGQRIDARTKLQSILAADPSERAAIAEKYRGDVQSRVHSLAGRGLSEGGYNAADLADIERTRILAEADHASKIRAAQAEYTSVIGNLNNQRGAEDANAVVLAGQSIQAGTGRFAREKPKGWRPPSLQAVPDVNPSTGQPLPAPATAAPAPPKPPTTLGPTGVRLTTGPSTRKVARGPGGLALDYARKRVRVA